MELNKCESKSDATMKSSTIALGVSLGISVLVGIFFLPLLIYHLTGQRRAYLVIQQTCFITYLIMELTPQLLLSRDRFSKLLFSSMAFLNEELKEMAPETNYSYTVIHLKWQIVLSFYSKIHYHYQALFRASPRARFFSCGPGWPALIWLSFKLIWLHLVD